MNWYLQLELPHDLRCRLPVPSVYVSQFHISWHWDPDALARWNTLIPTCRLVSKAGRPCAEATAGVQDCAGSSVSFERMDNICVGLLWSLAPSRRNYCGMKNGKVVSLE